MNPITLVAGLNPLWYVAAVVGVVSVSAGFGYVKGIQHESDRHADYRAAVETEQAKLQADATIRIQRAKDDTKAVADGYADFTRAIVGQHNSRIVGMLRACSDSHTARTVAAATGEPDARPTDIRPSTQSLEAVCTKLETDCAETTGQFLHLRTWVVKVCK